MCPLLRQAGMWCDLAAGEAASCPCLLGVRSHLGLRKQIPCLHLVKGVATEAVNTLEG